MAGEVAEVYVGICKVGAVVQYEGAMWTIVAKYMSKASLRSLIGGKILVVTLDDVVRATVQDLAPVDDY